MAKWIVIGTLGIVATASRTQTAGRSAVLSNPSWETCVSDAINYVKADKRHVADFCFPGQRLPFLDKHITASCFKNLEGEDRMLFAVSLQVQICLGIRVSGPHKTHTHVQPQKPIRRDEASAKPLKKKEKPGVHGSRAPVPVQSTSVRPPRKNQQHQDICVTMSIEFIETERIVAAKS